MIRKPVVFLFLIYLAPAIVVGDVIDFELTPAGVIPVDDSPLSRTEPYSSDGIAVTFGFDTNNDGVVDTDAVFEHRGNDSNNGFFSSFGTDTMDTEREDSPLTLGDYFLRAPGAFNVPGDFWITYDAEVTAVSGEIWDIDGFSGTSEQWRVSAFDGNDNLVASLDSPAGLDNANASSLDSLAWVFSLEGENIRRVKIEFIGTSPTNSIGLAFDNYNATTGIRLGDVNLDGSVNLLDVAPFIELITTGMFQAEADVNQDGVVNLLDVQPFVALLSGG